MAAILSLVAAAACGGSDLTLPPGEGSTGLEIVQGDEQTGPAGTRLADPLIVRLVDPAGNGTANRTVLWVIKAGGGAVTPATGMTDAEGFASAEWTLGPVPGQNVVEAQVPDIGTATFTSMATGGGGPSPPTAKLNGKRPSSMATWSAARSRRPRASWSPTKKALSNADHSATANHSP